MYQVGESGTCESNLPQADGFLPGGWSSYQVRLIGSSGQSVEVFRFNEGVPHGYAWDTANDVLYEVAQTPDGGHIPGGKTYSAATGSDTVLIRLMYLAASSFRRKQTASPWCKTLRVRPPDSLSSWSTAIQYSFIYRVLCAQGCFSREPIPFSVSSCLWVLNPPDSSVVTRIHRSGSLRRVEWKIRMKTETVAAQRQDLQLSI